MPRMKNEEECAEKSTVLKIRDEYDWGRILYDACHVFNRGFAEYLVEYAERYDNGSIAAEEDGGEAAALIGQRDKLLGERKALHDAVRRASANKVTAYRKYAKALPIGEVVSNWRRSTREGETCGENFEKYRELLNGRHELNIAYRSCLLKEKQAVDEERRHIDANLFATRTLNRRAKNIEKMMDKHRIPLWHPMAEDVGVLYDLIVSDRQTERLMAVCLNILNTYSEKEFSTIMGVLDRECVAERIFEFFSKFEHNYDFIAGCYDVDEKTGLLKLKPLDVLAGKLYNGYYFTLRGYVQRSYASVRFEKFNIISADALGNDGNGSNRGIDRKLSSDSTAPIAGGGSAVKDAEPLDEGMLDVWTDCNDFLSGSIQSMSEEAADELSSRFPKNPYYRDGNLAERMSAVISSVMNGVNMELVSGNVVGSKIKHIVLDSMGGAETSEEWRQNVIVITRIMTKYIKRFFLEEKLRRLGDSMEFAESLENE